MYCILRQLGVVIHSLNSLPHLFTPCAPSGGQEKCVNCEKNSVVKMFSVQVDLRMNGISLEEAYVAHASALALARPPMSQM